MRFQSASLLASLAVMAACGTSALQLPDDSVPVNFEPAGPSPNGFGHGAITELGPAVLGPGPEIVPELQPTQLGSGPKGAHNPTGLFGLVQDEVVYRMYCNRDKPLTGDYVRHYACFETDTVLKKSLSAPNPEHLTGYINNKGTNFVLFAGQIVTLSESIEIHVEVPRQSQCRAQQDLLPGQALRPARVEAQVRQAVLPRRRQAHQARPPCGQKGLIGTISVWRRPVMSFFFSHKFCNLLFHTSVA
ncbi:hypothetical protein L1887_47124 [Cichorium endivia]|nr:hypothetical protein L1887_47124 [Cichorium endivia]